jgi:hypothetical protein
MPYGQRAVLKKVLANASRIRNSLSKGDKKEAAI